MITIENLKETKMYRPYDIRVDRKTVYGNPYYMGEFDPPNKREQCIEKYRQYFHSEVNKRDSKIRKGIQRVMAIYLKYGKLRIFCHCVPLSCHGEVIRQYILDNIEEFKKNRCKLIEGL